MRRRSWRAAAVSLMVLCAVGLAGVVGLAECRCDGDGNCYESIVVSGAGLSEMNGVYEYKGEFNGRPSYEQSDPSLVILYYVSDRWEIQQTGVDIVCLDDGRSTGWTLYVNDSSDPIPPGNGWHAYAAHHEGCVGQPPTLQGGEACTNPASITVSAISGPTTEAGGTATFALTPSSAPTADVTISLINYDPSEGTVPKSVVLPAGSVDPVTVTITGVDDDVDDGDRSFLIQTGDPVSDDTNYDLLIDSDVDDIMVTNLDDDERGITVAPTSGLTTTEDGGRATFTVVLDCEPLATMVTIGISSDDTAEGTVDKSTLTFTTSDWNQPQTVTVTGANDEEMDGDIGYTIVTAPAVGGDYHGIDADDVSVTNLDNEPPVILIPTGQGGPESILDNIIPVPEGEDPPMAGVEPLVARYVVGDAITGSLQILGSRGMPTSNCYIHLYLYSVDITASPEARELLDHWVSAFNWVTHKFDLDYDTTGLTPGYYDLRLSFPATEPITLRIEVTAP
jgi:hypothetical protein